MDNNPTQHWSPDRDFEAAFDRLVAAMRDDVIADQLKTTVINVPRYEQMEFAYAVLKYLTRGTNAKVSYEIEDSFKTVGNVTVETDSFVCKEPEWFARAAEFANNVEIYPLLKNRIRMTFSFFGVTTPVK